MTPNCREPIAYETAELFQAIQNELSRLSPITPPRHVSIIPDGNRRWAKEQKKPFFEGYLQGSHTLIKTALTAKALGIPFLTVFSFSTENWKRPTHEQDFLWDLFTTHLQFYKKSLVESDIRLDSIGHTECLPKALQRTIEDVKDATKACSSLTLILAMNYGGRNEIIRSVQKLIESKKPITEETFSEYLDTHSWPDPDLIIRTGGDQRLSNFLLWQSSYAEFYVEKRFWPDFSPTNFVEALQDFQKRTRRHGGGDA